jgi:hypothetical protein
MTVSMSRRSKIKVLLIAIMTASYGYNSIARSITKSCQTLGNKFELAYRLTLSAALAKKRALLAIDEL